MSENITFPLICYYPVPRSTSLPTGHDYLFSGTPVTGTMTWIDAGPAGVFSINGGSVFYLQNSRGTINPPAEIISQPTWIQV